MADEHAHEESGGGHSGHGGGSHGGGGHEEHEGAPEWLISFADNVTLMMGFFVLLLAMNLGPKGSSAAGSSDEPTDANGNPPAFMLDTMIAIRDAFHNPVSISSTDPNDRLLVEHIMRRHSSGDAQADAPPGKHKDLESIRPGDYLSLGVTVLFSTRSVEVDDEAHAKIEQIAARLRGHRYIIEIRGHVSAAEAFDAPDRGMGLSYQRARVVAEQLVAEGIGWETLRIKACADNDRNSRVSYDAVEHRANQRVEIVETDEVRRAQDDGEENETKAAASADAHGAENSDAGGSAADNEVAGEPGAKP